jgi:hypothetical protein
MVTAARQAAAGYGFCAIFDASGGDHRLLFAIGAGAIAPAVILHVVVPRRSLSSAKIE